MKARTLIALLALLVALVALDMPAFSTAAFTSKTTNTGTVSAAADWTPPTVSVVNPGSPIKGTVTITANASDAETGIKSVTLQYLASSGGSWTELCTDTTAPYSCFWNTSNVSDGGYTLRAIATDNSGYTTTSDAVATTVANTFMVVLSDPGEAVRGSVNLEATLVNSGSINVSSVRFEYSLGGANSWTTICTDTAAPYNCAWDTAKINANYYDLRAVAVAASGATTPSNTVLDVLVDNVAPTGVTMTDPGSPLSGFRTFAASATDADSGVASVTIQYTTGTTWSTLCTIAASPYSCRYNTALLVDGIYSFRAVAIDVAGNSTTSPAVTNRRIDNTVSSVSMEDPGAFLTGTVALTANASSTAGVTSVRIQSAPSGTTTWTTLCTLNAAPYTCNWNSTTVANGAYDFRAVMVDGTTKETISVPVTARQVDNLPLRGYDIQTASGTVAGKIDAGDLLTFTYNRQVNLGTILSGWTGSSTPVSVRLRDGNPLGLGNTGDTIDILTTTAAPINLGSVNLRGDYIRTNKTATLTGTMTATTVTVNGVPSTVVTVAIGSTAGNLRTVTTAGSMVWTPNGAVTDLQGNRTSTAPVTESGALDRDF